MREGHILKDAARLHTWSALGVHSIANAGDALRYLWGWCGWRNEVADQAAKAKATAAPKAAAVRRAFAAGTGGFGIRSHTCTQRRRPSQCRSTRPPRRAFNMHPLRFDRTRTHPSTMVHSCVVSKPFAGLNVGPSGLLAVTDFGSIPPWHRAKARLCASCLPKIYVRKNIKLPVFTRRPPPLSQEAQASINAFKRQVAAAKLPVFTRSKRPPLPQPLFTNASAFGLHHPPPDPLPNTMTAFPNANGTQLNQIPDDLATPQSTFFHEVREQDNGRACISGRLTQLPETNTCWFAAALNMVMLTKSMRDLVLQEYDKRTMSTNVDRNVSPDILQTCPMKGNVGVLQRYLDTYLKEIRWGASNVPKHVPSNIADSFQGADESGWQVYAAFPDLLRALLPSGWSVISQHILKPNQAILHHGEIVNDATKVIFVSNRIHEFFDKMHGSTDAMILADKLHNYDIVNTGGAKIAKITQTYTLRAAALSLKNRPTARRGHVVAGFVCDGKQAVYDSMTQEAMVVDWKTINNNNKNAEFAHRYKWDSFTGALYVRADL